MPWLVEHSPGPYFIQGNSYYSPPIPPDRSHWIGLGDVFDHDGPLIDPGPRAAILGALAFALVSTVANLAGFSRWRRIRSGIVAVLLGLVGFIALDFSLHASPGIEWQFSPSDPPGAIGAVYGVLVTFGAAAAGAALAFVECWRRP